MIALLCAAVACIAPAPPASSSASTQTPAAAPARVWRAEGEICVRLERFETRSALDVQGARGTERELQVRRAGARLEVQGAPIAEEELWIEPADPALGLSIGSERYPGRLRVRVSKSAGPLAVSGLAVDNIVDLEEYLAGVVASEVQLLGAAPAELEAQAIASRSFAIAQLAARGTRSLEVRLFDSTRDQAYRGRFVPTRDPASQRAAEALGQALAKTRGMILTEDGATLDARFHAACGGRTADATDVFPEAAHLRALRSVDCPGCLNSLSPRGSPANSSLPVSVKDLSWRTTLGREQLDRLAAAFAIGAPLLQLEPVRRDRGGRWLEVELRGSLSTRRVPFETLRKSLKDNAIASNLVLTTLPRSDAAIEDQLMLTGRGRGHGVGLCQNGCHAGAAAGWSAAEILAHYYPGTALVDGR
ncbi:MAG TPA: SpoIID/LytB domain-containing protein [Planctomycetota bacterium]|nr:SpoIID/LytB domain-containing protein [Planctomycetota bacterium]